MLRRQASPLPAVDVIAIDLHDVVEGGPVLRQDPPDVLHDVGALAREVAWMAHLSGGPLATWPLTKIISPQRRPCEKGPASRQWPERCAHRARQRGLRSSLRMAMVSISSSMPGYAR